MNAHFWSVAFWFSLCMTVIMVAQTLWDVHVGDYAQARIDVWISALDATCVISSRYLRDTSDAD